MLTRVDTMFSTSYDRPRPGRKACLLRSCTTRSPHKRHSGDQPRNGLGALLTWAVHSNEKCILKLYYGTLQSSVRAFPWWRSHLYHLRRARPHLNNGVSERSAFHITYASAVQSSKLTVALTFYKNFIKMNLRDRNFKQNLWTIM